MLGIGVGIDYALLILTRYRAALAAGASRGTRSARRSAPPGRCVLIAGMTVVISLLGLFAMGLTYLYGVALAAIIAVLVVMAAAITLLPALLGFAGRADRAAAAPAPRAAPSERFAGPLEPRRAAPPVDGRDRRRRGPARARLPRRPGCGSASPTPATTAPGPPRARPSTW